MEGKLLTIQDLLAQKEKPIPQTARVYVPGLEGELEFQRRSMVRFQEAVGRANETNSAGELLRIQYELIYEHCPLLQEPALLEAYGVKVGPDVVPLVFRESIGDLNRAFQAISGLYGAGEDVKETVKN